MSLVCSISGEIPSDPVFVPKTGHLYSRRLLEAHLSQHDNQCPHTGETLNVDTDLVTVSKGSVTDVIRPRVPSASSVPGMIEMFQGEWDSLMLETFSLKKQLSQARQELSKTLYMHDAACRVIAKLMQERDAARE
jgi:pre-mRNA-processing factor 19